MLCLVIFIVGTIEWACGEVGISFSSAALRHFALVKPCRRPSNLSVGLYLSVKYMLSESSIVALTCPGCQVVLQAASFSNRPAAGPLVTLDATRKAVSTSSNTSQSHSTRP